MRIALCADGRSPHTQRWANGVVRRGHEVAVVWMQDELAGADLSSFDDSISHHAHTPPSPRRRPWMLPSAFVAPRRLARRLKPDLVHGLFLSGHGWTAHAFGVRPLVLSALGSDVHDLRRRNAGSLPERAANAYGVWLTRAAVAAADVVFADSTAIAAVVRERVPGTETRIVRFGVDVTPPPPAARASWRRRLEIPDDAFVLLSTRLMRANYNIETIIRALPAILERLPETVLILKELERFSDAAYRRLCLDLVDQLGVQAAVRIVGELDHAELLELHAAADVFVSVPTTDGTAVSVLEAMSAGVAIVATDAPGIDPTILQDETALLVPVRDSDALASAVLTLALHSEVRQSLVDHAHDVVRLHGDFERELDRAVALYEELVARTAGSRMSGGVA
jgi:glycosyltransferase involved in cell wall biosynthesis